MSLLPMHRLIAPLALCTALLFTASTAATAQAPTPPSSPKPPPSLLITKDGRMLLVGDACQRKTDNLPGRVTRDFCGRFYCGKADAPDLSEVIPDWPERHACSFRLVGIHCRCLTADGSPRQVHRRP